MKEDEFDTVIYAIGRGCISDQLNIAAAGIKAESNGKFIVNENDETNVPHIHAVGDCVYGRMELTPVAID